jgi:hypothetical protein
MCKPRLGQRSKVTWSEAATIGSLADRDLPMEPREPEGNFPLEKKVFWSGLFRVGRLNQGCMLVVLCICINH